MFYQPQPNQPPTVALGRREDKKYMTVNTPTEMERQMLQDLGWEPGEELPVDLASRAAAVKAGSAGLAALREQINLEKQQEAEEAAAKADEPQQPVAGAAEALQQIKQRAVPQFSIDDDTGDKPEEAPAEPEQHEHTSFCPRCNWAVGVPYETKITQDDKINYIAALGGPRPFEKSYELVGGQINIILREPTTREKDLCENQVYLDRLANPELPDYAQLENYRRYRLVCQLKSLTTPKFQYTNDPSAWGPEHQNGGTYLPRAVDLVFSQLLKSESLYNVIAARLDDFNRLLRHLEANSPNSDFWETTL